MTFFQSQGIVLHSQLFKERDKIITLFTKECGILKLFVKGKDLSHHALTERFTIGDYLYSQGRGDLFQYCEGALVEQNLHLRTSWDVLERGEKMIQAIMRSQLQAKAVPELYALFIQCLKKVEKEPLLPAFLLKLLKHEGILEREKKCSVCSNEGTFRFAGEKFCEEHAPKESLFFEREEEETLQLLSEMRSLELLCAIKIPLGFSQKIELLFSQSI